MIKIQNKYETRFITSKDGTAIGCRRYGQGPGVILVQGAMGSAENFSRLAEQLSDAFTVYVPDRRGRGISPLPYHTDHSIQKDIEDLDILLTKTDAHYVFGLSSGAVISLTAATVLPTIHKVAAFEPPLFVEGLPTVLLARYEKEIQRDNVAGALTAASKAVQVRPIPRFVPDWLLTLFNKRIMAKQDKKPKSASPTLKELVAALQYDFRVVTEMHSQLERFRTVQAQVLLLGGGKSPTYLKSDLDALEKVLPHVKRVTFPELDHGASWNYDEKRNPNGNPQIVAHELRQFFVEPQN
jgi:pimeloyl-ACP methyl ester carboxylesterase